MDMNPANWGVFLLLTKYCNLYLDDVKFQNVKTALWSGHATLNNFALRTDFMQFDDLPLRVVEARVETLAVSIPWREWKKKGPEIALTGVRVVVETTHLKPHPPRNLSQLKEEALARFDEHVSELISWVESVLRGSSSLSFLTKSMISTLLNNLKISITGLTIELRHDPGAHEDVGRITLKAKISKLESCSTNAEFDESVAWDKVYRFRKVCAVDVRVTSKKTLLIPSTKEFTSPLKTLVLSPFNLTVHISLKNFDLVEFNTQPSETEVSITTTPIRFRLSRRLLLLACEVANAVGRWEQDAGSRQELAKKRLMHAREKVLERIKKQWMRRSLAYIAKTAFRKEMYIRGYMLHLKHELLPENQIGFSHGIKVEKVLEDPRYISAVYHDLSNVLSLDEILAYRKEAVERHLLQVTGLSDQQIRDGKGQKKTTTWLKVRVESVSVELFALDLYIVRPESGPRGARVRENSFLMFSAEDCSVVQVSDTNYSPLATIRNRFSHISTITRVSLSNMSLWLMSRTSNFCAMKKPIFLIPTSLRIKFRFGFQEIESVSVKLSESDCYIYPEMLTAFSSFFSFCCNSQQGKYDREVAFFNAARPSPLFQKRSAIEFTGKLAMLRFRLVIMSEYCNDADAAVLEFIHPNVKAEKWPSDTVTVEIKAIRGFATHLPKANFKMTEILNPRDRVLFTAYFNAKLLISSYRTPPISVKQRKEKVEAMYKDLRTAEVLLSVISKEWICDLTGEQLKSLVALTSVWTSSGEKQTPLPDNSPIKLDLTTKLMRKATKQLKFALEIDCKGAIISVVSNRGPYMKIIAHQFEVSYKSRFFEQILLLQCQGIEVLDTRTEHSSVLFAIREGRQDSAVELIHKEQLEENCFVVDKRHVFIVTSRMVSPESEHYRNIATELQISAQALHLTYNPAIYAATLKVFDPIFKSSDQPQSEKPVVTCENFKPEVMNLKVVLDWGELIMTGVHEDLPLFSLYLRNVVSVLDIFPSKTQLRLDAEDLHCADTSKGSVFNRLIMKKTEEKSHFAVNYKSTSFPLREESLVQIRVKKARLVYLHRVVMDVVTYVQQYLVGETDPSLPPSTPMSIEVLFSDFEIELPRNSLSRESQVISIDKLTLRRNAGESSNFDTTELFEYEERQPTVSSSLDLSGSKHAARQRRARLNQYQRQWNINTGAPESQGVRDLQLTDEELRQMPDLTLKNLSVYYYKPETVIVLEAARQQICGKSMSSSSHPLNIIVKQPSGRLSSSEDSMVGSPREIGSDIDIEVFTPAPDPRESLNKSIGSFDATLQKEAASPIQSESQRQIERFPTLSASNWKIMARHFRLEDSSHVELMQCNQLLIFMFSNSELGSEVPKVQIQLEDDMNFYFPQKSYSFLLQTFLENMGELTAMGTDTQQTADTHDSVYYEIRVISQKAVFLFSTDPDAQEVRDGITEAELAQMTWDSLGITCSLMSSGSKRLSVEIDNINLRDQRANSLLGILATDNPDFEPYFFQSNTSDIDIPRANLLLEIMMNPTGEKDINVSLCNSRILVAMDLLGKVQGFFTAVFDPKQYPVPEYIKLPAVVPRAPMKFELVLETVFFLLPCEYTTIRSTLLVIRTDSTRLTYNTNGDAYNGPGSVAANCQFKIAHMFFSNFQQQLDTPDPAMLLTRADLSIEYVMQKPATCSSWIGEQIFVHLVDREGDVGREKEEDWDGSRWNFILTISEAMKILSIFNCFSRPSVSSHYMAMSEQPNYSDYSAADMMEDPLPQSVLSQLPRKTSPDVPKLASTLPGEEQRNFSLNLAIDKVLITLLNKDIHPLLSLQLATLGCYQSQGKESSQCQMEFMFTVDYFNQRTTSWEPAIEWCTWNLDLLNYDQSTKIVLYSDINNSLLPTNINISYALIDLLGGLWKNWKEEIEGTELSSATPYRFINSAGLPLVISTASEEASESIYIEPNEVGEVSRRFVGQEKSLRFSSINRYKIDIFVNKRKANASRKGHFSSSEEFRKVKNVPIDTSDTHVMPLYEKWTDPGTIAYKRTASKRVKTLKLKDRIESFFIQSEHERELTDDAPQEHKGMKCCACLPCFKKGADEEEEKRDQGNLRLLVVEVRWVQEHGYKEILIRSSLTLINNLPTLIIVEMTTLSSATVVSEVLPGSKLFIPLPVVNFGNIRVRPIDKYDWSRAITLSALSGIVNEKELKRLEVEGRFHSTKSLVLSFIPLICNNLSEPGEVPFSCALDMVKKKNNTIRRKVSKDERYRWIPDKRMPNMRAKSRVAGKQTNLEAQDEESEPEQDTREEELIFQERELILSSIMSITNALPESCKVELSEDGSFHEKKERKAVIEGKEGEEGEEGEEGKEGKEEEDGGKGKAEKETVAQGQTCHLFFRKFYETSSKIRIKLAGYNWSNAVALNFPKIKEEKKLLIKLMGKTTNHKLFIWLSVTNDDFGCWRMTIFAPFWILNKTEIELGYAEPDLFQKRREAKMQKDSAKVLKESAAPDLFVQSGEDDINEEDFKSTTKLYQKATDQRKSRRYDRHLTCPTCGYLTEYLIGVEEYSCSNCGRAFASGEVRGKEKEKDFRETECPVCFFKFTVSSGKFRKDLKCPNCDSFIHTKTKHVTMQVLADTHDESVLKRVPQSAPGAMTTFSSKKSASVFSASKQLEWSKFVIYSTSQMVTKLKVAMIDSEIKTGKNVTSKWSDTFSLGNAGTSGKLSFNMPTDMRVDLGVRIDRGKGVFHRTNIITFTPRYILKCHNSLKLVCRQVGTERNFNIKPDETTTFNWQNRHLPEIMSVALYNEYSSNYKWSGAFHIHEQGEFVIIVQNEARKSEDFILVSISGVGPTFVVQFQPQKKDEAPPYILHNYTKHQISYFQLIQGKQDKKVRTIPECRTEDNKVIPSFHYYTLDEETEPARLEVIIENEHKVYWLDQLGEQEPLDLQSLELDAARHRKKGLIRQKRKFIQTYKTIYMEVSDGWMYRSSGERATDRKRTSLLEECVKAVIYKGSAFFFYTCLKTYKFRAASESEAISWVQTIMDAKDASESLSWQLIHVDVVLDGATHIMSFRSGNAREQKTRHLPGCKVLIEQIETRKKMKSKEIDYEFQFSVSSVNVSIIDSTPQEVLLLSLSNVQFGYYHYRDNYEGYKITIDVLKLDNQMMQNMWPVICAPFARKEKDNKKSVFISFSKKSVRQLDHIHYLNIYLQPIELRLEGTVLNLLLHAYEKINSTFFGGEMAAKTKHREKPQKDEVFKYSYDDSLDEIIEMAESPVISAHELVIPYSQKKLFIEELVIQPFCIVLSVNMNSPIDSPLPRMFLISLASIGLAFTSIEAAEINMEGLKMYDMYQLRSRFVERLIQHYYSTCVFQVYKLLGAMEFLGNPANLLQTFKAGMKDTFVSPMYALMRNPTEFIPELLKGGFGMVTNTIHGVFSSASKLAGGIGRSLALLTMDQQFQRARRNLLNRKVSSIGDGLMVGLKQLSYGLIDGVTGILTSPMQGYRQRGVQGLFYGIGKGIVGTVVKPVSGLFDAFSATTSSLGKYARAKFKVRYLDRNRIPRHFHKDRILYPYDAALAQAQFLLYRFNPVYRHEIVIFFSELSIKKEKYVLIITKNYIFYMKDKPSASEKGKKFNRETILDIKTQEYAKILHIQFKDGKKLIIDCNWLEGEKNKVKDSAIQDVKWKELTEICKKFGRDARNRMSEDDPAREV